MTVAHLHADDAVSNVLDRLQKVTRLPAGGWMARCPAHDDKTPSLKIDTGADGRVLIHCHAGCDHELIVAALNLNEDDLFPPRPNGAAREIASYRYTDELGAPLFDVVRLEPKTFRQRRPDGTWGLGDTRRVLYRLPNVLAAIERGDPIYIVEGEKDVAAIEAAGATATCNPMGAGKWRDEYAQQLAGATVAIIVADNDDVGVAHAQQVAASLERAQIPHRIVLPAEGKDAADHLAAGRTLDELVTRIPVPAEPTNPIRIVTLDEFVSVTDDVTDPLIGTADDCVLPSDGLLLMYGDGGAGKTTLSIDALAHLACGTDWIQITVSRPLRILLIENEGPRGEFRRRLLRKITEWEGDPFSPNVVVLEEPWTRFTITEESYRHGLASEIDALDIDLVIVGPLASLGAKGTGTPDEINEFDNHIKHLRELTERTFALWIVHHENKAGDVSGAWERYPDTLVHIQAQGNGRTRVFWRKVRHSSRLHQTSNNLVWAAGHGFDVEEQQARDYEAELERAFRTNDQWRTATECKELIGAGDQVKDALKQLVKRGVFATQKGPPGRHANAICWRLSSDPEPPGDLRLDTQLEGFAGASDSLTPPMKESVEESDDTEPGKSNSTTSGETDADEPHGPLPDPGPDPDLPF